MGMANKGMVSGSNEVPLRQQPITNELLVLTSMSGNVINISGQSINISGNIVQISGQVVNTGPSLIAGYTAVGSISGGTQLSSGPIIQSTVKNISGNSTMWVGPSGINSGMGYILLVNDTTPELRVNNLNNIFVFAETSGQYVSFIAVTSP